MIVAAPEGFEDGPDRVRGGDSRSASVRNALAAAPEATVAVVHDAARPLVTRELVERCLAALEPGIDGAIAAAPMTDTVKEAAADGRVLRTLDRRVLWQIQTPQVFRAEVLRRALDRDAAALAAATDDAALVEELGGTVRVVEAPPENIKVTRSVRPAHRRGPPVLTDYHVHLRPDEDGSTAARYFTEANVDRYREAAEERGIEELGVAEHIHRFVQSLDVWTHPWYRHWARDDLDEYCDFLRDSGPQARHRGGLPAGPRGPAREPARRPPLGLRRRLDPLPVGRGRRPARRAATGSSGTSGARPIPRRSGRATSRRSARPPAPGMFDILAHPDLVKVWGPRVPVPDGDLRRFYERAMDGIDDSDVAVEVSTAGLRKPAAEIYPAPAFLEMCLEAGRPVSLSSDAHLPEQLGYEYERALELLDDLGVSEVAVFEGRERRLEPLG